MKRDQHLEQIYEQMLEESWKSTLAKTAVGAATLFGGVDLAYSPKLPEPTRTMPAERVVGDALRKEQDFIQIQFTKPGSIDSLPNFLKTYNKVKRNLNSINEYAKQNNVNLDQSQLKTAQANLEKAHDLSKKVNWQKIKSIFDKFKQQDESDIGAALTKYANAIVNANYEIELLRTLMQVYEDIHRLNDTNSF